MLHPNANKESEQTSMLDSRKTDLGWGKTTRKSFKIDRNGGRFSRLETKSKKDNYYKYKC